MAVKIIDKYPHLQDAEALDARLLKQTAASAQAEGIDIHVVNGKLVHGSKLDQKSGKKRSENSLTMSV